MPRARSAQIRTGAWGIALAPLLLLGFRVFDDGLGANPVEALTHFTGIWALRMLVGSLAVTPLRRLGLHQLLPARRILGLAAFGWASVHVSIYVALDLGFDFGFVLEDVLERPYITVGFSAWLVLLVLAVTSTVRWQKRLGRRWVHLHRAVYFAAMLAALHFIWLVKADLREPALYAGMIAVLLGARVVAQLRGRALRVERAAN